MIDSFSGSHTSDGLRVQINFYSSGKLVCDFFGDSDSFRLFVNSDLDFLFLYGEACQRLFLYLSESCYNELSTFLLR
jgi:hypothetical protein